MASVAGDARLRGPESYRYVPQRRATDQFTLNRQSVGVRANCASSRHSCIDVRTARAPV